MMGWDCDWIVIGLEVGWDMMGYGCWVDGWMDWMDGRKEDGLKKKGGGEEKVRRFAFL